MAVTTLYCLINKNDGGGFVNYGPSPGNGALLSLAVEPAGVGFVGKARLSLLTSHVFPPWSEVQIFLSDGTTLSTIYFGGFVGRPDASFLDRKAVAAQRVVNLDCVDYNVLLDAMGVPKASAGAGVFDNTSTDFATQITRIERYVCTGAYTVDNVTVNNALSGTVSRFGTLSGQTLGYLNDMTWRQLMQDRCDAYQAASSTTRPAFHFDATSVSATRIGPQLEVYDLAVVAAGTALYTFTDGSGAGITVEGFHYLQDGLSQETYVLAWSQQTSGIIVSDARSSVYLNFANPYNTHADIQGGTWSGKSYRAGDNLGAQALGNFRDKKLAAKENQLKTVEFTVESSTITHPNEPWPGKCVAVTWATEGFSATKGVIANTKVTWRHNMQTHPMYTIQVGNRTLGLGEDQSGLAPGAGGGTFESLGGELTDNWHFEPIMWNDAVLVWNHDVLMRKVAN